MEIGDVVKVIGQTVKMTVSYVGKDLVTCQWFDKEDHLHEANVKKEILVSAK